MNLNNGLVTASGKFKYHYLLVTFNTVHIIFSIHSRQLETRVHGLALGTNRTKPGHVVSTHDTSDVSVFTLRSVLAETSVVPRAIFQLRGVKTLDLKIICVFRYLCSIRFGCFVWFGCLKSNFFI